MAQIITVFGATGAQGGGVVDALLTNQKFKVRGVTRNSKSDKTKALEKRGVEVVEGNLNDPASLPKTVSGCYGVFFLTNYWDAEVMDTGKEIQQGKNLVDACKAAGVKHLIFSGAVSVKGTIGVSCPATDGKEEIERIVFASGIHGTCVRYPWYYENFLTSAFVTKDDNGIFVVGIPMEGKPLHLGSVRGAGKAVAAIFDSPDAYFGKTIAFGTDHITVKDIADILSNHLAPKTFKATEITADGFSKAFPGAEIMGTLFKFMQTGKIGVDMELSKQLDPTFVTFDDWVKENKDALNAVYQ